MRFVQLLEIYIEDDTTIDAGHDFINLAEARKIIKWRDPMGKHCSRISFSGLSTEHDLYFRETPLEIAKKCGPIRAGDSEIVASPDRKFSEHRAAKKVELAMPEEAEEAMAAPQEPGEFVTNVGQKIT